MNEVKPLTSRSTQGATSAAFEKGVRRSLLGLFLAIGLPALSVSSGWNLPSFPRLKTDKITYSAGEQITVEFSNLPGNYQGLIALAKIGTREDLVLGSSQKTKLGQQQGVFNFGSLPAGDYEARLYYDYPNIVTVQARAGFRVTARSGAPVSPVKKPNTASVKARKSTYSTGEKIVVEFSNLQAIGPDKEWITINKEVDPDRTPAFQRQWAYTQAKVRGQLVFSALPAGEYEARLFVAGDGRPRARARFRVTAKSGSPTSPVKTAGPPSIKARKSDYSTGEKIVVEFSNLSGTPRKDWVTLNKQGSPDTASPVNNLWKHTDGKRGSLEFPALPAGNYEARLYVDGALGERAKFRVTAPATVITQKNSYSTGEPIVVNFSHLPGNQRDLIALSKKGSPDNSVGTNQYVSGRKNGTLRFKALTDPGQYEARLYFDFGAVGFKVQDRHEFTVVAATVAKPVKPTPSATLQAPAHWSGGGSSINFRVGGQLRNARGTNAQLVLHFNWLHNTGGWQSLVAGASGYKDTAGNVAVWVDFTVGTDPSDLATRTLNIPISALNIPNNQTWNLRVIATLFVNGKVVATSPSTPLTINP